MREVTRDHRTAGLCAHRNAVRTLICPGSLGVCNSLDVSLLKLFLCRLSLCSFFCLYPLQLSNLAGVPAFPQWGSGDCSPFHCGPWRSGGGPRADSECADAECSSGPGSACPAVLPAWVRLRRHVAACLSASASPSVLTP